MRLFNQAKRIKALEAENASLKQESINQENEITHLVAANQELAKGRKVAEEKFTALSSQKKDYRKAFEQAHEFISRKGYSVEGDTSGQYHYSGKSNLERKLSQEVERLEAMILKLENQIPRRGQGGKFVRK